MLDSFIATLAPAQRTAFLLTIAYAETAAAMPAPLAALVEQELARIFSALSLSETEPQRLADDGLERFTAVDGTSEEGPEIVLTRTLLNEDLTDEELPADVSDWD